MDGRLLLCMPSSYRFHNSIYLLQVILNLLRKEPFPRGQFAKHKPRADGPFKVIKRIGENAYKIELPASYEDTFNLFDSGTHRR